MRLARALLLVALLLSLVLTRLCPPQVRHFLPMPRGTMVETYADRGDRDDRYDAFTST